MLLSSSTSPQRKTKDAFTSVAVAVCIIGRIAMENPFFRPHSGSTQLHHREHNRIFNWARGHQ